jgi:uncharacterized protein YndB with AHSA1/START domain
MAVTTPSGTVRRSGDEYTIHFEREYAAPIEDVWSAITTPERVTRWFGELRGTPDVGERLVLVMGDGDEDLATLDVVACDRPRRIELGWLFPREPYTRVVVELRPAGPDRTTVTLDHTGFPADHLPGYGCGWHHYLDAFDAYLAGGAQPAFGEYYPALLDDWRARVAGEAT